MRRQQWKNVIGTLFALAILVGVTAVFIVAENLLDITKAHQAGG